MYYISGTHEPIIDQSVFDMVQAIIDKKAQNKTEQLADHHFNKMIKCGECGRVLRRKIVGDKAYWSCNARDKGETDCNITQIPETEIEKSFIQMLSRLKVGKDKILIPMLDMLTELSSPVIDEDKIKSIIYAHALAKYRRTDSGDSLIIENEIRDRIKGNHENHLMTLVEISKTIKITKNKQLVVTLKTGKEIREKGD